MSVQQSDPMIYSTEVGAQSRIRGPEQRNKLSPWCQWDCICGATVTLATAMFQTLYVVKSAVLECEIGQV